MSLDEGTSESNLMKIIKALELFIRFECLILSLSLKQRVGEKGLFYNWNEKRIVVYTKLC